MENPLKITLTSLLLETTHKIFFGGRKYKMAKVKRGYREPWSKFWAIFEPLRQCPRNDRKRCLGSQEYSWKAPPLFCNIPDRAPCGCKEKYFFKERSGRQSLVFTFMFGAKSWATRRVQFRGFEFLGTKVLFWRKYQSFYIFYRETTPSVVSQFPVAGEP